MKKKLFTEYIKRFDFEGLFNDLGWDAFNNKLPIAVNDDAFMLEGVAQKKGFVIMHCPSLQNGKIPLSNIRKQIELKVAKNYFEHLIIYTDKDQNQQIWQLAVKEENKPKQVREVSWYSHQDVEGLFQRMKNLLFTLDEEESITIVDVKQRISENFAKNTDKVTKKFYTEFKKQHVAFLDFIQGIDDHITNKQNQNKQWYASLMLNRLMFCYFIQKKGFLDQDFNYLQNKLNQCEELDGQSNFYSFYRSFLLELFHDGLGKPKIKRKTKLPVDLGRIPYLNGGLFDVHELERQFDQIEIDDDAFKKIFSFFDQWNWHLDNSIEATGKDINPDVIGYIFEKYINDRAAMGAYYTKEDITDYIGKNTIIPFLFDETLRHYKAAFKPDGELWQFLKNSGSTYIYDAVKKGIPEGDDLFADLPDEVQKGINHPLEDKVVEASTQPHLWEIRKAWNKKAPEDIALPTEIYRELIERRKRYADIKSKIETGKITHINDFITYNLNIRQFTQDFIENTSDAAFIRHFYKAIINITILDPTCGSGAFLFAGLNILEPLYEACIIRMEQFVAEEPGKHKFFEETLAKIKSDQHPSLQYFIFKSIILNNLYGVDIMHEAVEIAKLRLFLKLVATVDVNPRKDNFGLEPLPDIDFNIRAGNTLIGFATEKELKDSLDGVLFSSDGKTSKEKLEEFKEEFELVSKAFSHFQNSQLINDQGSESFKKAKAQLIEKLKELNQKLNVYLATNYGIMDLSKEIEIEIEVSENGKKKKIKKKVNQYQHWLQSHQPFHWFAEFYQIVAAKGGFDCIVGNPPYVEYSKVSKNYKLLEYETIKCGNLYAFVVEKSLELSNRGRIGMIVPLSSLCTKRMIPYSRLVKNTLSWNSFYAERPAKLFDGAEVQLTISILSKEKGLGSNVHTTKYSKWEVDNRDFLFDNISYHCDHEIIKEHSIPKIGSMLEDSILKKVYHKGDEIGVLQKKSGPYVTYRNAGGRYYKIALDNEPLFKVNDVQKRSSTYQFLYFEDDITRDAVCSLMNSSLFFFHWLVYSDTWHMIGTDIKPLKLPEHGKSNLSELSRKLMKDFVNNSTIKVESRNKGKDSIEYRQFVARQSKPIIDQIDTVLAEHYGFTEAELDFIINYDIKYRMGKALFEEEKNEEED